MASIEEENLEFFYPLKLCLCGVWIKLSKDRFIGGKNSSLTYVMYMHMGEHSDE